MGEWCLHTPPHHPCCGDKPPSNTGENPQKLGRRHQPPPLGEKILKNWGGGTSPPPPPRGNITHGAGPAEAFPPQSHAPRVPTGHAGLHHSPRLMAAWTGLLGPAPTASGLEVLQGIHTLNITKNTQQALKTIFPAIFDQLLGFWAYKVFNREFFCG